MAMKAERHMRVTIFFILMMCVFISFSVFFWVPFEECFF